jgi:MFS family permease
VTSIQMLLPNRYQVALRCAVGGFAVMSAYNVTMAALPSHLIALGTTSFDLGLIIGCYAAGAILFRLTLINLVDQLGVSIAARLAVFFSLLAVSIGAIALIADPPFASAIIGASRLVQGGAMACFFTAGLTYVSEAGVPEERGLRLGVFVGLSNASALITPALGYLLWESGGGTILWILPILFVMAAFPFLPQGGRGSGSIVPTMLNRATLDFSFTVWPLLAVLFCSMAIQGLAEAHFPHVVTMWDARSILIPLYLMFGFGQLAGQIFGGQLSDKIGGQNVVVAGLVIMAPATVLPMIWSGHAALLIASPLLGLGGGAITSAAIALLGHKAKGNKVGAVFGLGAFVAEIGIVVGAVAGGPLLGGFGVQGFFTFAMTLTAAAAITIFSTWRRNSE